jgi:hypothetical protein
MFYSLDLSKVHGFKWPIYICKQKQLFKIMIISIPFIKKNMNNVYFHIGRKVLIYNEHQQLKIY